MAPATTVASRHHRSGGFSLSMLSLHASWHSCSKPTTTPGLNHATGQCTRPHSLSTPAHITPHPQHSHIPPPFCPAPLPLHIHQPFPQPPASNAQPPPIQRPVCHSRTRMSPKSNPTIHIDSCATFVGRPIGGARSS